MIRTNRGSVTVWSPQEAQRAVEDHRAEVLREAAGLVLTAFNSYPFLNYPPDFAEHLRHKANSPWSPFLCECGHTENEHQGQDELGGAQCLVCPEDGESSGRHPYTPHACTWVTALDGDNKPAKDRKGNTWEHCGICGNTKKNE